VLLSDVVFYATLLLADAGSFFSKNEELIAQTEGPQFSYLLPIRIIHWSCSGLVRGVFCLPGVPGPSICLHTTSAYGLPCSATMLVWPPCFSLT
jgi:hypothetical protein